MKRFSLLFVVYLFIAISLSAQGLPEVKKLATVKETNNSGKHIVDARPFLEKFNKVNGIDFSKLPAPQNSLKKTASWGFNKGDQRYWWAHDYVEEKYYSVPTTCKGIGENCYVFVEDSSWANGRITQEAVDSIINAFDKRTPASLSKGVYQTVVDAFGNPPDVDSDPRIVIVILNIRDGYSPGSSDGYTGGYFSSGNEYSTSEFLNSNEGEFYYMDCNPMDLSTNDGISDALQITAHEFQHMINWNYHKTVENSTFFNEGCSMIAEVVCGYPLRLQTNYTPYTNIPTFTWGNNPPNSTLSDYGRAGRFFLYVKEQCGVEALKAFVQSTVTDDNAFNISVLPKYDPNKRSFANFTVDWWIANFLNNKSVDSRYGYDYSGLPQVGYTSIVNPNVSSYSKPIYKQGVSYFSFVNGKNLTFTTTTSNTNLKLKAIKTGSTGVEVVDVATNSTVSMPEFGDTYSTITFMAYHNSKSEFQSGPFPFSFTSSGESGHAFEIAYDNTEPVGYISQNVGDSIAVHFEAIAGGKLDSIRVAIRNLVPLDGRILQFIGYTSRLGGALYANITAESKLTAAPQVVDQTGTYPYPQPYPNWTTIDLSSLNIKTDDPFVVEFPFLGKDATVNKLLSTYAPSTVGEHTALFNSESKTWGYSGVQGLPNYSWFALIRAYVSIGTSDVKETVELLPASYKLDQNYPNPFNPSTIIRYELPKISNVQIRIYDSLGKEVRSLINETQTAGTHNLLWDAVDNYGKRVSSGVYFYRIAAGDFVQTKKMVLMK